MSNFSSWWKYNGYLPVLILILFAAGCGGGGYSAPKTPTVMLSSNSVTFPAISQGATSGPMTVTVTNSGTGSLTISTVVAGGTNPGDFNNPNTCNAAVISPNGTCSINITFVPTASGTRTETITLTDNASGSPQVINVTGTANAISLTVTPPVSAIGVSQTIPFTATGDPAGVTWSVVGTSFLGSPTVVAAAGTIDANGNYTGPGGIASFYATVTATSKTSPTVIATATINVVAPGSFTSTLNPQVAQYAVVAPSGANVSVQFGPTTTYGLNTWAVPVVALSGGLSTPLYVAGMQQSTAYHMRGQIAFADGTSFNDSDVTFTTGALTAGTIPNITTTTTAGMTPQPGVEFVNLLNITASSLLQAVVTDLSGNIIWSHNPGNSVPVGVTPQPIKLLPNGHFLISWVVSSNGDATSSILQEVDLGSNVIWSMTSAQLNTALAAAPASCTECNVTILGLHHDIAILPNGHFVVLADTQKTLSDGTTPLGDVVIDIGDMDNVGGSNPNHTPQPTWAWNEFNHLDTNRRPYLYPDWTHTNAVFYSKDDSNLIISIRHQNWLIKIDYNNGTGAGDILWHLGYQGDFALLKSDGTPDTNATDWFFAQHDPSFTTSNTTGNFGLVLFDNGDDRGVAVPAGTTCGGSAPNPPCFSTVPVFDLDETAKTATLVINPTTEDYSYFGGNAEVLQNGNVEYDECSSITPPAIAAAVLEVTQSSTPQTVWKMTITNQNAYRAMRMPSLYPGVQW